MSIYWVLNLLALIVLALTILGAGALLGAIVWILYHEIRDIWGGDDE